jgi:hypothetical protein
LPAHDAAAVAQRRKLEIHQRDIFEMIMLEIVLGKPPGLSHSEESPEQFYRKADIFAKYRWYNGHIFVHLKTPV